MTIKAVGAYADKGYIYILIEIYGKRVKEFLGLKDTPAHKRQADELVRQIRSEIYSGTFEYVKSFPDSKHLAKLGLNAIKRNPTFRDLAEEYADLLNRRLEAGDLKLSTFKSYKKGLRDYGRQNFYNMPIRAIKLSVLKYYILSFASRGKCGKTANNLLTPLRGIFRKAYEDELIDGDPMERIRNPRIEKSDVVPFSENEMRRILSEAKLKYTLEYPLILTLFMTGMRTGEALAMKWKYLDLSNSTYRICESFSEKRLTTPKTRESVRKIRLPNLLIEALSSIRPDIPKDNEYIFKTHSGHHRSSTREVNKDCWRKILSALNIPYRRLYNSRHTYAVIALEKGDAPQRVAAQLGHASVKMVYERYARFLPEQALMQSRFEEYFTSESL